MLAAIILLAGHLANTSASEREAQQVDNALDQSVSTVLGQLKSIAWWDEAVQRIHLDHDYGWVHDEIGLWLNETYGHDEVFVLDGADRPVYSNLHGVAGDPALFERRRVQFEPMLRAVRSGIPSGMRVRDSDFTGEQHRYQELLGARLSRWQGQLLAVDGRPSVVAAMTIVPNLDASLLRGKPPPVLIGVVPIGGSFLHRIGRTILLDDLQWQRAGRPVSPALLGQRLVADDGAQLGTLSWTGRSPGYVILYFILPLVFVGVVATFALATHLARRLRRASADLADSEALAWHSAKHDALSGLPNRSEFLSVVSGALAAADGVFTRLCVAYVDVDRFKDVNDVIGHGAGDALVARIGPRLHERLREDDLLARLGGDEFAILRALAPGDDPAQLGETILDAFKAAFPLPVGLVDVTASIGLAVAAPGAHDADRLIQDADISLYRAKDQGRARYVIFEQAMADEVNERHRLEKDLRAAIGTDQIRMHYQPVFSVRTGAITSFEALVRWQHPRAGSIPPDRFIGLAERTGLMPALGDVILQKVFADAAGLPDVAIAINLSAVQLLDRRLDERLSELAAQHAVSPSRIILEVTETTLIDADVIVDALFAGLRRRGFRIALDDFGTGYSSLSYLQRFRFDTIKIDRSFVSSKMLDRQRPIIQAVVTIGRGFDMDIVAEGIENVAEYAFVRSLGCTAVQGFWLSRPLAFAAAREFLAGQRHKLAEMAGIRAGHEPMEQAS